MAAFLPSPLHPQTAYHTQLMPTLLKELEALERERLLSMESHLRRFAVLFRDMFEPFESYCASLDKDLGQMNATQSMSAFSSALVSHFGEPPAPPQVPLSGFLHPHVL